MAKFFIFIGIAFLALGTILLLFPNALAWFGKLPGDVNYHHPNNNVRIHFPIATMIIVSIVATIVLNLFVRLFIKR